VVRKADERASGILGEQTGVAAVEAVEGVALADGYMRLRVTLKEGETPLPAGERLLRALLTANVDVASLAPEKATLEQIFAELTEAEVP
jgi:hypothetical protein